MYVNKTPQTAQHLYVLYIMVNKGFVHYEKEISRYFPMLQHYACLYIHTLTLKRPFSILWCIRLCCVYCCTVCCFSQFPDLASFLLARASRSTQLANYFYWYLSVECSEGKDKLKYNKIRLKFLEGLKSVSWCTQLLF